MTKSEQETTVRWDRESADVTLWSADPAVWRKMARLGVVPVKETTLEGAAAGKFYRIAVGQFRWGLKSKRVGNAQAFKRAG